MGTEKEDRRVVRTRQLLQEALVSLILERGYEEVTVQDILDRANLGRSTFYAHFRGKDDLLFSGFEQFAASLHARPQEAAGGGGAADFSLHLFRHVAERRRLLKALWGHQGSRAIMKRSEAAMTTILRRQVEQLAQGRSPAVPLEVVSHYIASSLMALMTLWLDRDLPYTAEQMDAMFRQLTMPGVLAALGSQSST